MNQADYTRPLADVLAELHGNVLGADLLRRFANDEMIRPTLNEQYYQACLDEADRIENQ